jgi:hypothetical protein
MITHDSIKRGGEMAEMYEVQEEVTETQADGRIFVLAGKGARIPMREARRLGLVKDAQTAGPSETKETAPAETKAQAKAARKSAKKSSK